MAATERAMTSLPTPQTIFLPTVDDNENNRINFRDSLKFFQEQLVLNGANFPSPSTVSRPGNDTLRKNGLPSYKENNSETIKVSKNTDVLEDDIKSMRSCKIAIPTVDTILESVRVLRAIQKSQEERGSPWKLDVTTKTDIDSDFSSKDDWIQISKIYQNGCSDNEPTNEENNKSNLQEQASETLVNSETIGIRDEVIQPNAALQSNLPITNPINEICPFWPSNAPVISNFSNAEKLESSLSETKGKNGELKHYNTDSSNIEELSKTESILKRDSICDEEQNSIEIPVQKEQIQESIPKSDSICDEEQNNNEILVQKEQFQELIPKSDSICDDEQNNNEIPVQKEEIQESIPKSNSICDEEQNKTENTVLKQQIDINKNNVTESFAENITENVTEIPSFRDTPDYLRAECTNLLEYMISKVEDKSKEIVLKEPNTTADLLKIETYEDIDAQKHGLLLNESLWKDSCSPNYRNSLKTEHNDSDSGFGTQRSGSSLSPNNPSQMHKDSWSDSCSSHYASAECSPYQSLNSVFETSLELSTVLGETKTSEDANTLLSLPSTTWDGGIERAQEDAKGLPEEEERHPVLQLTSKRENDLTVDEDLTEISNQYSDSESHFEPAELDTEISYCNFVTNYTIEKPCERIEEELETETSPSTAKIWDNSEEQTKKVNYHEIILTELTTNAIKEEPSETVSIQGNELENDSCDWGVSEKFSSASCDLLSIVESLYTIKENPAYQILPATDAPNETFEETLFILSKGAFCEHPEDNYLVTIKDSSLNITKNSQVLCSLDMKYGEISLGGNNVLKIDNRMGRCVYIQCNSADLMNLKVRIELNCLKHWQTDCLQLVHYPLKFHQNVVVIDLGSCSTRAGILMDQATLPSLFFPTVCATDKRTGTCFYGMEALQSEVRQHSNLSFPVRPTNKITKHTINIDLLEGLFKKIFCDLKVDPTQYTIQVCLPRNLSITAQTALMKLLLVDLKVNAVSLTNQALLTLYAHDVSTAVVVDIGDRTDVLPVVDGFIVENGVTKLPHGGQRLIHHMKHGLAEKRISLSNDIDSFIVQYIIENLAYVANDYDQELQILAQYPERIKKTISLHPVTSDCLPYKTITLEEARFKIPEGLFNPDLWGLDSPGIHHLVQKAIQATSVDARKQVAENIYVSGGVTMLPGFIERLNKEVAKLSKAKIVPKVNASNYRYHCTYIGACKFAKMEVFPQVCVNLHEYSKSAASALKKCALYF